MWWGDIFASLFGIDRYGARADWAAIDKANDDYYRNYHARNVASGVLEPVVTDLSEKPKEAIKYDITTQEGREALGTKLVELALKTENPGDRSNLLAMAEKLIGGHGDT
ncbi:MAG: hypothetical protein ACXVCO_10075 [Ktedonobacterales bacterium]